MYWFNSVFGWTAQKSVIISEKLIISNNLFWNIIKGASMKCVQPKFQSFIKPVPQWARICFWQPVPQPRAYKLSYAPTKNKTLKKLLCCAFYLRKSFIEFPLFLRRQCVKRKVWDWTYFWSLSGANFFAMVQAKTKL